MLEDPASNVAECRLVDCTTTEFPIRRNARRYLLPSRWAYMIQEYGACSGTFRLPAACCTTIVEVPIDWGTVEALPAPSEKRGVGSASTRTSGEGDSTMATWTCIIDAAQPVAPTGTRTAWTASTVKLFIDE